MSVFPTSSDGRAGGGRRRSPTTPGDLGLYLFLASLGVIFAAALLAYLAARTGRFGPAASAEGLSAISMPVWFWFSTLFILLNSAILHYTKSSAAFDRPRRTRRGLWAALVSVYVFLGLQAPGLAELVSVHRVLAEDNVRIYAMVMFLVILHALHVLGGLIPLTVMGLTARRRSMGVESHVGLRRMTIYWHFLAIVWIVMFNAILLVS